MVSPTNQQIWVGEKLVGLADHPTNLLCLGDALLFLSRLQPDGGKEALARLLARLLEIWFGVCCDKRACMGALQVAAAEIRPVSSLAGVLAVVFSAMMQALSSGGADCRELIVILPETDFRVQRFHRWIT